MCPRVDGIAATLGCLIYTLNVNKVFYKRLVVVYWLESRRMLPPGAMVAARAIDWNTY